MIEELAAFAEYLNTCGYAVGVPEIGRVLALFSDPGTDFTDYEDAIGIMRPVFSSSRQQYLEFPAHLSHFVKHQDEIREEGERRKQLEEARQRAGSENADFEKKHQDMAEKLADLKSRREKKASQYERDFAAAEPDPLSARDRKLLEKNRAFFERMEDDFVRTCLAGGIAGEEQAMQAMERFSAESEKALLEGRTEDFERYKALYGMAKKIYSSGKSAGSRMQSYVRGQLKEEDAEISQLEQRLLGEKKQHDLTQQKISEEIRKLEGSLTVKAQSVTHREEFIGRGAVQTLYDPAAPECLDTAFDRLTAAEEEAISAYILRNVLAFRTRMTRNIAVRQQGAIDMQETVQQACRTGGVPMILARKQKRPGKTNLVLILDVSGSCRDASGMMLTFIYYLQQVFPNGCRVFAFVNSLYDISDVMKAGSITEAVEHTLAMIPRRGVYSDYTVPLRTLWEEKRNAITADSMVIIIGDARNNHRASCEEYLKNICRRAKKAYWLNTETRDKWNHADSEADTYRKYARMYEVTTPGQLVWFLNEGMRTG